MLTKEERATLIDTLSHAMMREILRVQDAGFPGIVRTSDAAQYVFTEFEHMMTRVICDASNRASDIFPLECVK